MVAGEGSFGRVWRATWRSSDVAVKEFFFRQSALSTDASQKAVSHQLPPTSVPHPKYLYTSVYAVVSVRLNVAWLQ